MNQLREVSDLLCLVIGHPSSCGIRFERYGREVGVTRITFHLRSQKIVKIDVDAPEDEREITRFFDKRVILDPSEERSSYYLTGMTLFTLRIETSLFVIDRRGVPHFLLKSVPDQPSGYLRHLWSRGWIVENLPRHCREFHIPPEVIIPSSEKEILGRGLKRGWEYLREKGVKWGDLAFFTAAPTLKNRVVICDGEKLIPLRKDQSLPPQFTVIEGGRPLSYWWGDGTSYEGVPSPIIHLPLNRPVAEMAKEIEYVYDPQEEKYLYRTFFTSWGCRWTVIFDYFAKFPSLPQNYELTPGQKLSIFELFIGAMEESPVFSYISVSYQKKGIYLLP